MRERTRPVVKILSGALLEVTGLHVVEGPVITMVRQFAGLVARA